PALACDEIALGGGSSLGPITPEGQAVDPGHREPVRVLATRKGREPDLLLGLLDRDADLRAVQTDKQVHYLLPERLAEFKADPRAIQDQPAWEGGRRGVLTAARARDRGFAQLLADTPAEVANYYRLAGRATADDPTLGQELRPVWVQISGPI